MTTEVSTPDDVIVSTPVSEAVIALLASVTDLEPWQRHLLQQVWQEERDTARALRTQPGVAQVYDRLHGLVLELRRVLEETHD